MMKVLLLTFSLFVITSEPFAQVYIKWQHLPSMPIGVSNNAVIGAVINDTPFVFSFGGIDTSKKFSGITLRSFRYNTITKKWNEISPLPDSLGKIACAASVVKNKIYIIGGYHVFKDGHEVSSSKVHVYDPIKNQYEVDGASVPEGIDDHVQGVWRDSLIYVVTGWSQDKNVANVQTYDPVKNIWQQATPVPDNHNYKVFGGSGVIIGDTIYYAGGAYYAKFYPPTKFLRKGVIDRNNPLKITWTAIEDSLAKGYRMAVAAFGSVPVWLGGSAITYNYNGFAYKDNSGVKPLDRLLWFKTGKLYVQNQVLPAVMDLRGIATIGNNQFVIAGGMTLRQQVSDRVYLIKIGTKTKQKETSDK